MAYNDDLAEKGFRYIKCLLVPLFRLFLIPLRRCFRSTFRHESPWAMIFFRLGVKSLCFNEVLGETFRMCACVATVCCLRLGTHGVSCPLPSTRTPKSTESRWRSARRHATMSCPSTPCQTECLSLWVCWLSL